MKRIYFTSLNRVPDPTEDGDLGKLYVLDWDTKELLTKNLPGAAVQVGRSRGIRGITWYQDKLLVAGVTNRLSFYDPDTFREIDTWAVEHAKFLHQVRVGPGPYEPRIYMASTGNDRCIAYPSCFTHFELDLNKDIIDPYITHPNTCQWGGDRLHFNSIAWDENGDEYHVYNATKMIFNYTKKEVFCHSRAFHGLHDIVITPTHIITNSSGDRTTLAIDRQTKDISVIHKNRRRPTTEHNLHGMTRGLALYKDLLFIGSTPGDVTLYRGQGNQWEFETNISISTDPHESIFDILLDPRDWT